MLKLLALSLLLSLPQGTARAGEAAHCHEFPSPMPQSQGEFCIHPGSPGSTDVLYYLHGKGGNARIWGANDFWSRQVREYWAAKGLPAPTVVSVSLGELWLLAPKSSAPLGFGMMELFTGQVMPKIEAQLGGIKGRRLLLGDSMGGFNAIQLGLKTDLFAKVAALCAPMAEGVDPFSSEAELETFVKSTTAYESGRHSYESLLENIKTIQMVVGFFWGSREEWLASSPIDVARSLRGPRSPFYLAAGFFDHYMVLEGNAAFAKALASTGTPVDWRPQWGGHCAVDVPSLGDFLVK